MLAKAGIGLCAALLIALVMLPEITVCRVCPARDSGGALYAGWRILKGDILYRDVWDHKAPLLYYLNALGLLIGKGTTWGLVACEFLTLVCAVWLGFSFVRDEFGIVPALFGTAAWMLSLPLVLEGGNFPEEYALPLQFAALLLFSKTQGQRRYSWPWFLIGLTCAAAFLLRPNLIGIWLSMFVVLLIGPRSGIRSHRVMSVAMMLAGAASTALEVAVYFAANGGLASLWDAVFRYNAAYASATATERVAAVREGILLLSGTGLVPIAFCGWVCALVRLAGEGSDPRPARPVLQLLAVALPVEMALAGASGRAYHHYYVAWLPVFAALAAFLSCVLASWWREFCQRMGISQRRARLFGVGAIFCILIAGSICPLRTAAYQMCGMDNRRARHQQRETVALISRMTGENDCVLVWGAEPSVNFLAGRRSPGRFTFQYPLLTLGYRNGAMVREFIDNIGSRRPALIIDTSSSNTRIPPLDPAARGRWRSPDRNYGVIPEMDDLFDFIGTHYKRIGTVGPLQWTVYGQKNPTLP